MTSTDTLLHSRIPQIANEGGAAAPTAAMSTCSTAIVSAAASPGTATSAVIVVSVATRTKTSVGGLVGEGATQAATRLSTAPAVALGRVVAVARISASCASTVAAYTGTAVAPC